MASTKSPLPPPSGGIVTRKIKYSFAAQTSALLIKSARNQMRQVKTNICLLAFPVALSLALFSFQYLVNALVAQADGSLYSPPIMRPPVSPFYLYVPLHVSDCPAGSGITVDTQSAKIIFSPNGQAEVGNYVGPPLTPQTLALLPSGFVNPDTGSPEGILGNASTPLNTFLAYPALVDSGGNIQKLCFSNPQFEFPVTESAPDRTTMESNLYKGWGSVNYIAGIDFQQVGTSFLFDVLYNFTLSGGSDLPIYINFVSNAVWRTIRSNATDSYLTNAGVKDYPKGRVSNSFNIVSLGCPNLYVYIFMLLLPITMENLVAEKENRLRETMRMMGLKTHVYFISMYLWNYFMWICLAVFAFAIGCLLGFQFWLANNFWSYFVLLFIWGHTLIAMSWLISIFITSARTAVVIGYAIILAFGILCTNLIRNIVLDTYTPKSTLFGLSVIPPIAFFIGLNDLNNAIAFDGPGLKGNQIASYGLPGIYGFLIVEWVIMLLFAIYFELVLPIGPGAKKDPLFFLPRSMWLFKTDEAKAVQKVKQNLHLVKPGDRPGETTPSSSTAKNDAEEEQSSEDDKPDDVLQEERNTLEANDLVVKSLGLHKVYTRGGKSKVVVRHLTMGIRHGECFGFLGPNGAGKSTTISMLCGYLRPTSGTATINGLSIKDDMDEIHLQMGVCPQDDALWPSLTGPEHLEFYGRLKNLSGSALRKEIDFWLEQVNLHSKKTREKQSCEYSGGMKRRLSVACAMIGSPSLVLMDEPTTGLDPASRIALWNVVKNFKSSCAMMLTTHSMEEAEALCDRLGIFVAGRFKTIGRSSELKDRYGKYYKIQMTTNKNNDSMLLELLQSLSPNVRLLNSLAGTNNFEVPSADIPLSTLFEIVEAKKEELGITHWGVSNTTLEEVFLKVTADEVQDEALKFAKRKKKNKGRKGCCGGSSSNDQSDNDDLENPAEVDQNEIEMARVEMNGTSRNNKVNQQKQSSPPDWETDDEDDDSEEEEEEDGSEEVEESSKNQSSEGGEESSSK